MKITNEERLSILDEFRPEKQMPGDVTVKMAEEDWGISRSGARDILEKAVKDGKLIKLRGMLYTGKLGTLYRPVVK